jgi:ribonuclease III
MTKRVNTMVAARAVLRCRVESIVGAPCDTAEFTIALTHPSFAHESGLASNQRLEFLGDAVLGLCVSELLSTSYPSADEGELSRMRSSIVSTAALAAWARDIELGPSIALGKGAQSGDERKQSSVLADAVEALIACVYTTLGITAARALAAVIVAHATEAKPELTAADPKSTLQERVQAIVREAPEYVVIQVDGPTHDAWFTLEVRIRNVVLGTGRARSKKDAAKLAAQDALTRDVHAACTQLQQDADDDSPAAAPTNQPF